MGGGDGLELHLSGGLLRNLVGCVEEGWIIGAVRPVHVHGDVHDKCDLDAVPLEVQST